MHPDSGHRLSRRSLRICIASGTFHPDVGGPPTYLLALGSALLRRGHVVQVVTYGDRPARRRYPFPVLRVPRGRPVAERLARFALELVRVGRSADLLFVNDYGLPGLLANLALRKPLVMKVVGDFAWEWAVRHRLIPLDEPLERFQRQRHGPRVEVVRRMQAAYATRADRVVVPSRYVGRFVAGWGVDPARIVVVENAVEDPLAGVPLSRADARQALDIPADADVVLTVARLTVWKGIDTLIEAVARLRSRRPDAVLVVVGDGPDRRRLEDLAARHGSGQARFVGQIPRDDVPRFLRAADVLALCSAYEGLSHVLLEAMAAGMPVVASSVGGNLELIRPEENGLLVKFGDVDATAEALDRILGDPSFAARLSAAARQDALRRGVERMVERTEAVFFDALGCQTR